jgi:hypothetical protein
MRTTGDPVTSATIRAEGVYFYDVVRRDVGPPISSTTLGQPFEMYARNHTVDPPSP